MVNLETPRLHLRPFTGADLDVYHATIYADADVMTYLPGGVPRPIERTAQTLSYFLDEWRKPDGARGWALIDKADGRLIGHAGLMTISRANPPTDEIEIFYALAKPYWGQGLTTEAARAVLEYGFRVMGLPRIVAVAYPENTGSRRVMAKNGMTFLGITHRYYDMDLAYYALTAEEWEANQTI